MSWRWCLHNLSNHVSFLQIEILFLRVRVSFLRVACSYFAYSGLISLCGTLRYIAGSGLFWCTSFCIAVLPSLAKKMTDNLSAM